VFIVNDAGDRVLEGSGQGTDTVLLRMASFSLSGINAENDTGDADGLAFSITGNGLANQLTGGGLGATLLGSSGHDTLIGLEGDDRLDGGSDNDLINGGNGVDSLAGSTGDDTLDGGTGADTMSGWTGNDMFMVDDAGDRVLEGSGHGTDTVLLRVASFSLGGIVVENVTGDADGLAFSITGNSLANQLTGDGLGDTLRGSSGHDSLIGLDGDDRLDGGSDDDRLEGGLGADTLIGASGTDSFVFNTALGSGNVDRIQGYDVPTDIILLDDTIFTGLGGTGALATNAFHVGTAAVDVDDRIIFNSATGALLYDADGVGGAAAVQFATLTGIVGTINAAEFLIV